MQSPFAFVHSLTRPSLTQSSSRLLTLSVVLEMAKEKGHEANQLQHWLYQPLQCIPLLIFLIIGVRNTVSHQVCSTCIQLWNKQYSDNCWVTIIYFLQRFLVKKALSLRAPVREQNHNFLHCLPLMRLKVRQREAGSFRRSDPAAKLTSARGVKHNSLLQETDCCRLSLAAWLKGEKVIIARSSS